jgi:transposase
MRFRRWAMSAEARIIRSSPSAQNRLRGSRAKGSYFSAQYSRIARRRGANKAAVAVANSILAVIWHVLTNGCLYGDPGADYFERRHDPAVEAKRLQARIEALGFDVTLSPKAA